MSPADSAATHPSKDETEEPTAHELKQLMHSLSRARAARRAKESIGPGISQEPGTAFALPSMDPIEDIRRDVAALMTWATTVSALGSQPAVVVNEQIPATPPPKPDGPDGGRWVWWRGNRRDVPTGVVYAFIQHMWNRDAASYDSLDGTVFESSPSPPTLRSAVNKVNNTLRGIGIPWKLRTDSVAQVVTKVDRSNPHSGAQA